MVSQEVVDAIRYAHLLSVAVGLGAAALADIQVFQSVRKPITRQLIAQLKLQHKVVWAALAGMWLSGLALIYIRTGFALDAFTPKLYSKLFVVTLLTLNAHFIGRLAIPMLRQGIGRPPTGLPFSGKLVGGWISAMSSASWLLALGMGGSKVLAVSGWGVFALLLPGSYGVMLLGATLAAIFMHALNWAERRWPAPEETWFEEAVS